MLLMFPRPLRRLAPALALLAGLVPAAFAYEDRDGNKIDDRIDAVHALGWNAAFVNGDPAQRMRIGVENPAAPVFAIYVRYDHRPTPQDELAIRATGATMAWPFVNIPYVESRATWPQVAVIAALPGVTAVEAVPVDYATNHYGSRVVRSRDSRGLAASENFVLFPSVRTNLGFDGTGVVVAILDTGVNDDVDQANPGYPGHESLRGKFLGGGEFWCGQPECSTPADGSTNPQDHGGEASSYHATHVAGTIMGTGGPGGFFAGVAPGARLVDCKVLSDAGASVGGSNRGLDWAISNRHRLWAGLAPGSIWQGIDVVSMSLGSTECTGGSGSSTGASSTLVNTAVDSGLVVVIATGNDGATNCIASPAAADASIAVGASAHYRTLDRSDDKVTSFSNEGPRTDDGDADHFDEMKPSVVAPGAGIISAFGDPTTDGTAYQQRSGTSMATPHVSGVVALVLQANPNLTPMQVRSILQNTAEHNLPTEKATGDRGQDPYGLDANYDPGCGWGLVDAYAACKEAMNGSSGVQVVQIRPVANLAQNRVDLRWITQREYPFLGFNVFRAPDVKGAAGAFTQINTSLVAPTGHPDIQGTSNRTPYLFADADPGLVTGNAYWYRVDWVDLGGVSHPEPPAQVTYGAFPRVASVFYQLVHNAVDNDLTVRIGADLDYSIGTGVGGASVEILGPGETAQDSARVILPATVPANTGSSTTGTIEHFWSVGIRQGDRLASWLPPNPGGAWFLSVTDGGFVNRTGRLTGFSIFVNDSPGSASGTTYVTNHQPMPAPLVEHGPPTTLWIPEQSTTDVTRVRFRAENDGDAVRLQITLPQPDPLARAIVFRNTSEDFDSRVAIGGGPLPFDGAAFTYVDREAAPATTYWYWVQVKAANGTTFMNGPVQVTTGVSTAITAAGLAKPNPFVRSTDVEFTVGRDAAGAGRARVALVVRDVQGRCVRRLLEAPMAAGIYHVTWDATDRNGRRVSPGTYYLSLDAGAVSRARKLVVLD